MRIAARSPGRRRSCCATCQPSISGIAMSSRMSFGLRCLTSSRHSLAGRGSHDPESRAASAVHRPDRAAPRCRRRPGSFAAVRHNHGRDAPSSMRCADVTFRQQELDAEGAALAHLTADRDVAAHDLGQQTSDRQPQSGPDRGLGACGAGAFERLKNPFQVALVDADAGVLDVNSATSWRYPTWNVRGPHR